MPFKSNIASFTRLVNNWKDQPAKQVLLLHKKVVLQALSGVVLKTRVDTGNARGGWQASIDSPIEVDVDRLDKSGGETIAAGMAVLDQLNPYGVFWIANSVEYIEYLEYGTARTPPDGMVATTVEELKAMFA